MDLGFTAIPAITAICYLLAEAAKTLPLDNKFVPVICGIAGLALGVCAMFVIADYPASDPITAAAIGVVSGFAATGVNQVYRQLKG